MSTNSMIGRKKQYGYQLNYIHWDGYPSGVGKTLWDLYHGHFQKDVEKMMHVLIDEHPAGWSEICDTDFNLEPGYCYPSNKPEDENRPQCYCHGTRNDEPNILTKPLEWCEWMYVIDETTRYIEIYDLRINKHTPVYGCSLDGDEPNWKAIENGTIKEENDSSEEE